MWDKGDDLSIQNVRLSKRVAAVMPIPPTLALIPFAVAASGWFRRSASQHR